ncbi:MAG: NADH:flavin oxidoreductase [Candidatus Eisenbacteria sp.]|nr:NADH:flavin oxidoreductase [Candidatus Eisenbacteria bacterium]
MALFEESAIGSMNLRNRLVRSATAEGMAPDTGEVTDDLVGFYSRLARGGVGLIIGGHAHIAQEGRSSRNQVGIHHDRLILGLRKLVRACHNGGAKVVAQLTHAGSQTTSEFIGGNDPAAPSAVEDPTCHTMPREMTEEDIEAVIGQFAAAARRARDAGFDAVQLHGAHGYLLSQFLSPHSNRRTDSYGGTVENRIRFTTEVFRKVRQAVGPEYPVLIKMNAQDYFPGGTTLEDSLPLARALSDLGINGIEVSGGLGASGSLNPSRVRINHPGKEAYFLEDAREIWKAIFLEDAREIRNAVKCPIILVGGIRSLDRILEIIDEDVVDYFAMSRPLIREPDLPNNWKTGIRSNSSCISCNQCFKTLNEGGLHCVQKKKMLET